MEYWSKQDYRDNVSTGAWVIKYGTEWCAPCRKLESFIKSIAKNYSNLRFVSVDGDEMPADIAAAEIHEYPTMRLCINGVERGRSLGYGQEDAMKALFTAWNELVKLET
jgi:thiol-disulfide isomerase/thioredoxin